MTDELVGWKATKRGDRWAALEPLYQGVRYAFGRLGKGVARGLTVAFIERYNAMVVALHQPLATATSA